MKVLAISILLSSGYFLREVDRNKHNIFLQPYCHNSQPQEYIYEGTTLYVRLFRNTKHFMGQIEIRDSKLSEAVREAARLRGCNYRNPIPARGVSIFILLDGWDFARNFSRRTCFLRSLSKVNVSPTCGQMTKADRKSRYVK